MTVANTLAYYITATITAVKFFIVQTPGIILITFFGVSLLKRLCKLDHSIDVNSNCLSVSKRGRFQKSTRKFTTKKYYEIADWLQMLQNFYPSSLTTLQNKLERLALARISNRVRVKQRIRSP